MKTFETKKAPAAIGPYSQAKMAGKIRQPAKLQGIRLRLRLSSPAKMLERSLKKLVLHLTML